MTTRDDRLLAILRLASSDLTYAIRDVDDIPPDVVVLGVINCLDSERQILDELAAEIETDRRERLECAREDAADGAADAARDDRLVP